MGQPDMHFISDLFELRGVLEPVAAASAAERRTEAQIGAMRYALAQMKEHKLSALEGQEADRQFHRVTFEAAGNEALASLSSSVGAAVQWTTHFNQRASKTPRDPLPEHEAVFTAISAADGEAARIAMINLLRLAYEDMAEVLQRTVFGAASPIATRRRLTEPSFTHATK